MRRAIAAIVAALFVLGITPAPAQAVANDEKRCTHDFYPPFSPAPELCMRVWYEDNGGTVTLQKATFWMVNPRTAYEEAEQEGFKIADTFVRCRRNDGTVDYFIPTKADVNVAETATYTINPTNMNCGEQRVEFAGLGILKIHLSPDLSDDYGSGLNYLPSD